MFSEALGRTGALVEGVFSTDVESVVDNSENRMSGSSKLPARIPFSEVDTVTCRSLMKRTS